LLRFGLARPWWAWHPCDNMGIFHGRWSPLALVAEPGGCYSLGNTPCSAIMNRARALGLIWRRHSHYNEFAADHSAVEAGVRRGLLAFPRNDHPFSRPHRAKAPRSS
jgi:hypothetical protein